MSSGFASLVMLNLVTSVILYPYNYMKLNKYFSNISFESYSEELLVYVYLLTCYYLKGRIKFVTLVITLIGDIMSKRPRTSLGKVLENKLCVCGKKFKRDENDRNIKKHYESCKTAIYASSTTDMNSFFKPKKPKKENLSLPKGSSTEIPIGPVEINENMLTIITSQTSERAPMCEGFHIFNIDDFYRRYPFAAHSNNQAPYHITLKDFIPLHGSLYSTKCYQRNFTMSEERTICHDCSSLGTLNSVNQLLERSQVPGSDIVSCKVNNKFLNFEQITGKLENCQQEMKEVKLTELNQNKKLSILRKKLAMHERFIMALSENDVPRLRQLIAVCIRQRRGVAYIVDKLQSAISGLYSPKGYNEVDLDIGTFVLIAGGPRLLHVLHKTSGLPSLSTAYRMIDKENPFKELKLTATHDEEVSKMTKQNLNKVVDHCRGTEKRAWSLKVDEIAIEKRLRYNSITNEIVGLCAQHPTKTDVIFSNSYKQVENLEDGLSDDRFHLATESSVFSLSRLGENDYHAKTILSLPICNHRTQRLQKLIFEAVFTCWKEEFLPEEQLYLINIATDGDSVRRSVLESFRKYTLQEGSPIFQQLYSLKYLDLGTAVMDVTFDFDAKHILKRLRNNLINGQVTILGTGITSSLLKLIFTAQGMPENKVERILNPIDRQNVPLAVSLAEGLCAGIPEENLSPGLLSVLPAFAVLNHISYGILCLFAKPALNLEDIIGYVSTMSHVLLILKHNNDITLPNVLYHDIQSTVQNLVFTAAKYKVYFPTKKLFVYQTGSDQVEQQFNCVRTQNHDRNCDAFQLENRLQRAAILDQVLNKNPDWKQKGTRLSGPVDHTNPSDWTGDLTCENIDLSVCWEWGRCKAIKVLPSDYLSEIDNHMSTILKPGGRMIGVQEYVAGEVEEEEFILQDGLNVNEDSDAFREFEDMLMNGEDPLEHSTTLTIDGEVVYKSSILKALSSNVGFLKSGDRLRRVQGLSRYCQSKRQPEHRGEGNDIVAVKDPLCTLSIIGTTVSLIIFFVGFIHDAQKKSITYVNKTGAAAEAMITGRPISLTYNEEHHSLCCNLGNINRNKEVKVLLIYCATISLEVLKDGNNSSYHFSMSLLRNVFDALIMEYNSNPRNLPKSDITYGIMGEPILQQSISTHSLSNASADDLIQCQTCSTKLPSKKLREHVGQHILRKDIDIYSCGFCGQTGCSITLKKSSHKILVPDSNCLKFCKFSLKSAETSKIRNPCTNRPLPCGICKVVYWSYAMEEHYKEMHTESACPKFVSEIERTWMLSKFN